MAEVSSSVMKLLLFLERVLGAASEEVLLLIREPGIGGTLSVGRW